MEKKKIILPTLKFDGAPDENLSVNLKLNNNESLLRQGDRDVILNIADQFNQERNDCKNYRIYGKIKMVFRNLYSGTTSFGPLKRNLHLVGDGSQRVSGATSLYDGYLPYNEFAFLRNDVFREKNEPLSGSTPGLFTQNISIESGYTQYQIITPADAPYWNWNVFLTYVYSGDTNFPMKYTLTGGTSISFKSGDGIPFRVTDNGKYYTFTSPVEHGMNSDNYIVISGGSFDNSVSLFNRTFNIASVGNEIYNSEKYVVNVLKSEVPSGSTFGTIVLGKRCLDISSVGESTSVYYVQKHRTLTSDQGYILDKLGFENPIWEDEKKLLFENSEREQDFLVQKNRMESVLFSFKNPFTLTGITNNLGYTPTDVYVSIIFRNRNGYFEYPPKVGYKFHLHDSWIDDHFNGNATLETGLTSTSFTVSGITFNSGNTIPIDTILTGAFVEYNKSEIRERVISDSLHKISNRPTYLGVPGVFDHDQNNPFYYSGAAQTNLVGLLYQPHYKVKLRELSPYVEIHDTNNIYNLPENVIYDEYEKVWKWRDLYDHGYIDVDGFGTNFPFLNNSHYVHADINFYIKNELLYKNKRDGVRKFKNINEDKIDC